MTNSWPQIRGLSYSTIGRTLRATVHGEAGDSTIWFGPPDRWRVVGTDGTPRYIENETDEYRLREDGVAVHTSKSPNRMVATFGLSPTLLFRAHTLWPMPGPMAHPQVGAPGEPLEVSIRGRRGWQIEFADLRGGSPVTVVIDAETGVTLSWRQDDRWLEMSDPVLDEDFDPQLFVWDGPTVETEEQLESPEQLAHEQKMREVAAMPPTQFGWPPTEVHVSALDGDPLSGALESTATVSSIQVGVRRWLTEVGEPEVSFMLDHWPSLRRRVIGPWAVELRAFSAITDEDSDRILSSLILPDPPVSPEAVRERAASREAELREAAVVEQLGTGRKLDDHLGGDGGASLLIRTDFSDDELWRTVVGEATAPNDDGYGNQFSANLLCIDDPNNSGMTVDQLLTRMGDGPPFYAFIADSRTLTDPEHPILAVDNERAEWGDGRGRTVRIIPREMWGIENNLSISNMDFREFADSADDDGVFRGFPPSPPVVTIMERDDLIALSASNLSTPALVRFAEDLAELERAHAVIHEVSRKGLHDGVVQLEDSENEIRDGVDEYLAASSRDGICHWGFVQILAGHWSLVIEPASGRLEAAMLRKYSPPSSD
ncbi:DUF6924 domain-containing protein [Williamsia phyllosphaerae]|uniref:DUF6924 domain-containing protein n=1 Tax=Williamsia phyllosphaerae TaxID=885042 RepID=A0ABQ1UFJ1_9NOCA|nr:hypothetical protein [Williamsia phyllosphaerae]GGF17684.1 hypothetical protein GCM10007298_12130 [Williamsia phyllosphaerae]